MSETEFIKKTPLKANFSKFQCSFFNSLFDIYVRFRL